MNPFSIFFVLICLPYQARSYQYLLLWQILCRLKFSVPGIVSGMETENMSILLPPATKPIRDSLVKDFILIAR